MARARNIKPGFFRNEHIVELPFETRLLFIGLWTLADREGRLKDRPTQIKIDLFPCDNVKVDKMLNELVEKGFIIRYSVDGNKYIQVVNFAKHQNPHVKEQASEIPAPDKHGTSMMQTPEKQGSCTADSLSLDSLLLIPDSGFPLTDSPSPQPSPAGSGGAPKMTKEAMFKLFWESYPKKKSKGQAEKAWNKIKPDELLLKLILNKLEDARSSPEWTKEGGKYIPYPATWLNAKGWEDEFVQGMDVPDAWNVLAPYMREDDPNDTKRYS